MRITDEAWAAQVERADRAEQTRDNLLVAIRLVLREHDDCLCRHAKRIFSGQLGLAAMDVAGAAFSTLSVVEVNETTSGAIREARSENPDISQPTEVTPSVNSATTDLNSAKQEGE